MTAQTIVPPFIRVLVTDDSLFMRTALTRLIESDPALKLVGTARNGLEMLEKAAELEPDVITLDIEMPVMDGLEALRRLMRENPRPVIILSSLSEEGAEATLKAFDLGAFECIPKQFSYGAVDIVKMRDDLVAKVKAAAAATYLRRPKKVAVPPRAARPAVKAEARGDFPRPAVITMGVSTGGPLRDGSTP